MLRLLNILAVLVLVGSAVYAYSIKYQTSFRAEQIAKTKIEIRQERDAIAVLRAEWAFMTRPERLQQLVDAHLPDMKQVKVTQIVAARELPDKAPHVDMIGQKLDVLLGAPATPISAPEARTTTPKATTAPKTTAAAKDTTVKPQPQAQSRGPSHGQQAVGQQSVGQKKL